MIASLESQTNLAACLARSAGYHERLCPRQVLGVRMGLYAGSLLGLQLPGQDKRVLTFIETDGCLADGVSAATGCWFGRHTMRLVDFGKVAATFVDTQTSRAVRVWPRQRARQRAALYAPEAPSRWHAQRDGYQRMPDEELLAARFVEVLAPLETIIIKPGIRVTCAACREEIMNEREVTVDGKPLCRGCAGEKYVRYLTPSATIERHNLTPRC